MIKVDSSWQGIIEKSYSKFRPAYRNFLENDKDYFPSYDNFLNAFKTLPVDKTRYILFGQDPYPREESAIGYAFIDGGVGDIFSENGLSKSVNRATSLRNFIKMLLVSKEVLSEDDCTPNAIKKLDKKYFIRNIMELKDNFEKNGVLLLNMSLIFTSKKETPLHVKEFLPFISELLWQIQNRDIGLIMLGNISKKIQKKIPHCKDFRIFEAMHPYNIGFIKDSSVRDFFKPMNLLDRN
ncbi:MAG: uracil-DNA glycosylase [Sulfurospirillum sp.]